MKFTEEKLEKTFTDLLGARRISPPLGYLDCPKA
jgi:hypothetical protein